jgi:protein TonB
VIEGRNKPVKVMNTVNFTLEETPAPQAPTTKPAMASLVQPVAPPDSATRILSQAPAAYPVNARQSQAETSREHIVRLRIRVDESGQPVGWMLMQSVVTENGFIDAARDAAMKSKYSPAMKGGRPMSDWVPVTYTFSKQNP